MLAKRVSNEQILALEERMKRMPDAQIGLHGEVCSIRHIFADGVYAREMTMPKGAVVVGKIHRYEHICVVSKGRVSVRSEADGTQEIQAPYTFVSKAGAKRVLLAHEETIWTTIHNNNDNIQEEAILEELFTANTHQEFLEGSGPILLSDEIAMPKTWTYITEVRDGKGCFAKVDIKAGGIIGPGRIGNRLTYLGRFTSHKNSANASIVFSNKDIYLIARCNIKTDEEISLDYQETVRLPGG